MSDAIPAFFFGIICGLVLIVFLLNTPSSLLKQAKEQIEQCEKDLPRSQHCVLTAVVEDER
jgi:hypothetical protein